MQFVRTIKWKSKKEKCKKKPIICVILRKKWKLTVILSSNQHTHIHTQKSWYDCKYSLIKQAITNLVDKKAKHKKNGKNIFLKTQFKKNERLNLNWLNELHFLSILFGNSMFE